MATFVVLWGLGWVLRAGDEVLVVDDHSSDGTAGVARSAGARVLPAPPLPAGWAGKQWACHTGASVAASEVLVFLDADTRIEPGGLDRIAARPGLTSIQPFHLVPRWQERLAAFFNIVGVMGTGIGTPLGDRVRPGGAFGPCLLTSNMASATTAIRPVASLAVAGWIAACVAPLVLAGRRRADRARLLLHRGGPGQRAPAAAGHVRVAGGACLSSRPHRVPRGVRPLARAHLRTGASQLEGPLPPHPMSQ